jgi:DNA-directed RNA polymerase, mitochondrial
MTTPGQRFRESGEREYNITRAAKKDVQLEKDEGLDVSRRGRALFDYYLPELKEHVEADKSYGRRDRDVWKALKDVDNLEDRLLRAGITVAASTRLGVDNHGEKNARDTALYIGRALGQRDVDISWKVGNWGADMLRQVQDLFYLDANDVLRLHFSDEVKELCVAAIQSAAAHNPTLLPDVRPPEPWSDVWRRGGDGDWAQFSLVNRAPSRRALRKAMGISRGLRGNMSIVLDAINALETVPWSINTDVFHVVSRMPPLPEPAPPWLAKLLANNDGVLPSWLQRKIMDENDEAHDFFASIDELMSWELDMALAAEAIKRGNRFFVPHRLDYRGRIYSTTLLSYQRGDSLRGLFAFADPVPIGEHGLLELKCYVAGKAKAGRSLSSQQRVAWVDEHYDEIRRVGETVLSGDIPTIPDAFGDPVQYMAACTELVKANGDPDFRTSLPISFDATCSGLQHLTALTGSEDGKWVNLAESDIAQDLYAAVAEKANALMTKRYWVKYRTGTNRKGEAKYKRETFGTKDEADNFVATVDAVKSGYVDIDIDRDIAKQPASTFYYGATRFGMIKQIRKALKEKYGKQSKRSFRDEAAVISSTIYAAVEDAVPAATQVYEFMSELAGIYADHGKYMKWTAPTGFQVINLGHGDKSAAKTIGGRLAGRRKRTKLITDETQPDKESVMRCAAPNLIHSMDAALAAMVVTAAAEEDYFYQAGIPMAIVHDCFAAPAPRAGRLRDIVHHQMFALYNPNNMLQQIYEAAVRDLPNVEIPKPPPVGSFTAIGVKRNFFAFKS